MNIKLKDGSVMEMPEKSSVRDLAFKISEGLARKALGASVNGKLYDLRSEIKDGDEVEIVTFDHPMGKSVFWHSSAHLLAQAVKRLFPGSKLAIGPAIDNGFYYDIDYERPLTDDDLIEIESTMKKIAKENLDIERFELPRAEALELVKKDGEIYKEELINDLPDESVISFYKQGEFVDLCRGPHVMNTKEFKAIKLMKVAGAYWRGNEKNKMLTRVYGITFPKQSQLDDYLAFLEEAKKRDHRKLSKELGLFTFFDEGPGFPVYLNKGLVLKEKLIEYWRRLHRRDGYIEIQTPIMLSRALWEQSGHWFNYRENMYTSQIDEQDFAIKPMNCPGGILAYKQQMVSYRDLPMRVGELGTVHRHELSGALHGLMRVRSFTQDDAHIYMMPSQIRDEIYGVMNLVDEVYSRIGFKYEIELSTRPENAMGDIKVWNEAEAALKSALEARGAAYKINEGDGAFYGPKIDFHLIDCLGRTWQCATIQLDFQLPERFNLEYIAPDGSKQRPIMIHRVIFGSIERFIGILIEHYAGAFPLWLAPVQLSVLPISDEFNDYAVKVSSELKKAGFRVNEDLRNERIGYKIREATHQKYPYLIIVGKEEQDANTISIRPRGEVKNITMGVEDFITKLRAELVEQGEVL